MALELKKTGYLLGVLCLMVFLVSCSEDNRDINPTAMENTTELNVPTSQNSLDQDNEYAPADTEPDNMDATAPDIAEQAQEVNSTVLIAYFSRVGVTELDDNIDAVSSASLNVRDGEFAGNSQVLAEIIAEATGGELFQIITEKTYPTDYRATTEEAMAELQADARPALSTYVGNMDGYNTVFLVYPNWWGTLPMPVLTFLEGYDFNGKTIVPLCTHEGSRMGSSVNAIQSVCPDTVILDGLAIRGTNAASAEAEVLEWLNGLNL